MFELHKNMKALAFGSRFRANDLRYHSVHRGESFYYVEARNAGTKGRQSVYKSNGDGSLLFGTDATTHRGVGREGGETRLLRDRVAACDVWDR